MLKDLQSDSFDSFMRMPNKFFMSVGLIPYSLHNEPNLLKYRLMLFLFFCSFTNLILLVLGECIYFCKTFGNFKNFVDAVSVTLCIGFIFLALAKVSAVFWKRDQMSRLMSDLEIMFPKTDGEAREYNVGKFRSQTVFLMKLYATIQMVMIWCFNFYPLTETLSGYMNDGSWEVDFPYIIWYPFNPYAPGYFELNWMSQMWAAYVSAAGMLATDLLLCGAVEQICMHFEYLNKQLLSMRPNARTGDIDYSKLKKIVRTHNEIIRLTVELDDIFGGSILFNFVSSSVIICVVGFLVTTADRSIEVVKYSFTLISSIIQVYIVCLMGDKFIVSSTGIADAVYNSYWFDGPIKYKKSLVLIIQRSFQRPQKLTAYKFSVANMKNFSNVSAVVQSS
ncbi:odorant receptor 85c-like [Bradysia coprophila]|uniref:odorant receptor 85c-like n=1 Tax=Bradysia coprophila TaxID=38358 RepID=UPI00187DA6F7|nr:odorant receptor 85c-like [Bradysia coprophila]